MWSKLPFPIIGFMIRWKSSSKFGIKVENFNFFFSCFFKKTLNFSTFHSNISKWKKVIKDLIMADEEQIIYFFDIHSICEHPLKWLRKLNILMIFLAIFPIGAKKAQNESFVIHNYMEVLLLHWSCSVIYMPKNLILSSFSRQTKNVLANFDHSYKWEQWFYEAVW